MPHANRHDKEEHTEQVTPDAMTRAVNAAASARAAVKAKTRRAMRIIRTLEKMAADTESSETDEQWKHVYQVIDAERPHRPLFDGLK